MIVVRNTFQIKFGRMKEARELWDLTGPFYTPVMETTHKDAAAMATDMQNEASQAAFGAWYQKFIPLVDSGHRELYTIVE